MGEYLPVRRVDECREDLAEILVPTMNDLLAACLACPLLKNWFFLS